MCIIIIHSASIDRHLGCFYTEYYIYMSVCVYMYKMKDILQLFLYLAYYTSTNMRAHTHTHL